MLPTPSLREIVSNTGIANPKEVLWRFVVTHRFLDPRSCFVKVGFVAVGSSFEESAHDLTIAFVLDADDAGFDDTRVLEESLLDFGWVDVLAAYKACVLDIAILTWNACLYETHRE